MERVAGACPFIKQLINFYIMVVEILKKIQREIDILNIATKNEISYIYGLMDIKFHNCMLGIKPKTPSPLSKTQLLERLDRSQHCLSFMISTRKDEIQNILTDHFQYIFFISYSFNICLHHSASIDECINVLPEKLKLFLIENIKLDEIYCDYRHIDDDEILWGAITTIYIRCYCTQNFHDKLKQHPLWESWKCIIKFENERVFKI